MKIKCVFQSVENECGACCVSTILKYNHINIPMYKLREELGVGKNGVLVSSMKMLFEKMNFEVKVFQCNSSGAFTIQEPSIIGWENNHYVVLIGKKKKYIEIMDPAIGIRRISLDEFNNKFNGYLLIATSNYKQKIKENKPKQNNKPIEYFFSVIGIEFIAFLISFIQPYFVQLIVDSLNITNQMTINIFVGILIVMVFAALVEIIKINLISNAYVNIGKSMINKILNLPYKLFHLYTSGNILFRINCMPIYKEIYYKNLPNMICNILLSVVSFVGIAIYSFDIALVMGLICIFIVIIIYFCVRRMLFFCNENVIAERELSTYVNEIIVAIKEIKLNGIEEISKSKWKDKFLYSNRLQIKIEKIENMYNLMNEIIYVAGSLLILVLCLIENKMSLGRIMACYSLAMIMFRSLSSVFFDYYTLKVSKKYLDNLYELLDYSIASEVEKTVCMIPAHPDICVKNMSFRYTKYDKDVLSSVEMDIPYGSFVAILGRSGVGKSTLLKLLLGMYDNYQGSIKIGGIELNDVDKIQYYKKIGVVSQDFVLFNMSIMDNIIMEKEIPLDAVRNICKIVHLDQDIMNLPMGYNTIVQDDNFSGGQRQRIAIARALITQPEIVIFDEATNFLDKEVEYSIMEYLTNIGCTRIFVTHKTELVKDADYIYYMDEDGGIRTNDLWQ